MKKLLGFASLLLIALLTACNADNLDEIAEAGGAVVSEADRVPVVLCVGPSSTTTSVTRAPLDTDDTEGHTFSTPDGQYLGVFALAQTNTPAGGQAGPVATDAIMWDGTVQYARLMWNVPTKAIKTDTEPPVTYLQFLDKSTLNNETPSASIYSYPRNNWYNYHFYSYYPRVDDANVSVTNNVVTADYTLDGSQDIITSVATPPQGKENDGFCRSYFENNPSIGTPQLQLNKHHLAQLRFFVRSKADPYETFQVKGVTLLDVPTDWMLTIADKADNADKASTGTLISRSANKANIPVRYMEVDGQNKMLTASDDAVYVGGNPTNLTLASQCVGYAMVPTTEMIGIANNVPYVRGFSTTYKVSLDIKSNDKEVTVERTITTPLLGYEKGKVYNIIITIDQAAIQGSEIPDERIIDLGLSVCWGKWNVGATSETDRGQMFAWAGTTGFSSSDPSDHDFILSLAPYYKKATSTKPQYSKYKGTDNKPTLLAEDDAAAQVWGGDWRMPTQAEFTELMNTVNIDREWYDGVTKKYNGSDVPGMLFTSKIEGYVGNSIFMPVAGYRNGGEFTNYNTTGYYWSTSLNTQQSCAFAYSFVFDASSVSTPGFTNRRFHGLLIRPVKPKE